MAISVVILCGASETATFVEQFAATCEDWLIKFFKTAASVVRHLRKKPADLIIVSMAGRRFNDLAKFAEFYDMVSITPILMSGSAAQRRAAEALIACGARVSAHLIQKTGLRVCRSFAI